MKRWIHADDKAIISNEDLTKVDKVPNIDNQYLPAEAVIGWLDKLVEVAKNEENSSDK